MGTHVWGDAQRAIVVEAHPKHKLLSDFHQQIVTISQVGWKAGRYGEYAELLLADWEEPVITGAEGILPILKRLDDNNELPFTARIDGQLNRFKRLVISFEEPTEEEYERYLENRPQSNRSTRPLYVEIDDPQI
jgi:hypothetical protein